VGQVIALLAEEGDDISNLEAPKEEVAPKQESAPAKEQSTPPPTSQTSSLPSSTSSGQEGTKLHGHPTHSRPLFPSVLRLLTEHGIEDTEKIKGTGIRGMLTKGDVLAFLGKASGPMGTYKEPKKEAAAPAAAPKKEAPKVCRGLFSFGYSSLNLFVASRWAGHSYGYLGWHAQRLQA
jgi:pyruvate/2-oxoglutarate dehydrogenase complex dihydrolipoamide acyltransferase (E2) component